MNDQFEEVVVYKCRKCGQLLQTKNGCIRHSEKCKFEIQILDGQINIFDNAIDKKEDIC